MPVMADRLSLLAGPIFAIMALFTAFLPADAADMLCSTSAASPLTGMTAMYALMCVFHLAPWLRLLGSSQDVEQQP